jgi:hypothetical protein
VDQPQMSKCNCCLEPQILAAWGAQIPRSPAEHLHLNFASLSDRPWMLCFSIYRDVNLQQKCNRRHRGCNGTSWAAWVMRACEQTNSLRMIYCAATGRKQNQTSTKSIFYLQARYTVKYNELLYHLIGGSKLVKTFPKSFPNFPTAIFINTYKC